MEDYKPYNDENISEGVIKRTFSNDVSSGELEWHRDKEDRIVKAINENDWMIQFDNGLPRNIGINEEIKIPKETFHRVIKGTTDLVVEINKNLQISENFSTFVKNTDMKDIIKSRLDEMTQPATTPAKPDVKPDVAPAKPSPRRRRIWETKPSVKPKPKMEENVNTEGKIMNVVSLNDNQAVLDVIIDGKLVNGLEFNNTGEVLVEPMAYDEEWVYSYETDYNDSTYGIGVGFFGHPQTDLQLSDIIDDRIEKV